MYRDTFTAKDGKQISYAVWDGAAKPKAVVQIIHGMVEHIERYKEFAEYLNLNSFIVAGDDHRAHGLTDMDAHGLAGEGDLFENTVSDELMLTDILKEKFGLPVIVLGHSYGSFITQRYLTYDTSKIAGCILSGSALMPELTVKLGRSIAKGKLKKSKDEPGKTFANMTFKKYDKKFKDGGLNAWLTRDTEIVGKYNTDPLCGFMCSNGFYYHFFNGLISVNKSDNAAIRKDLKMLIIAGADDGVGGYGKLVKKLCDKFVKLGLSPEMKLYSKARHEILNEINREEVYEDILDFVTDCVQ